MAFFVAQSRIKSVSVEFVVNPVNPHSICFRCNLRIVTDSWMGLRVLMKSVEVNWDESIHLFALPGLPRSRQRDSRVPFAWKRLDERANIFQSAAFKPLSQESWQPKPMQVDLDGSIQLDCDHRLCQDLSDLSFFQPCRLFIIMY